MLMYLRVTTGRMIRLGGAFYRDLAWFVALFSSFNKSPSFQIVGSEGDRHAWIDASLTGIGAVWDNKAYAESIPHSIRKGHSIVHYEMYNAVVMIKHWAKEWQGSVVHVHRDNMAVVQCINSLRANDEFLGVCIRNLLMEAAQYNIHIRAHHVAGIDNTRADALSRLTKDANTYGWVRDQVTVERVSARNLIIDFIL